MTILKTIKNTEKIDHSYNAVPIKNAIGVSLENHLPVSYKTTYVTTTQPSNYTLGHLWQGNEN